MNEIEEMILDLAKTVNEETDEFIRKMEELFVGPTEKKGDFFLEVGLILSKFSFLHLALKSWKHALKYSVEYSNEFIESRAYINLGNAYRKLGYHTEATKHYEKSLRIARKIGDIEVEMAYFTGIGNIFGDLGDFLKSLEYHRKSLSIAEEINDRLGQARCCVNIGGTCRDLGDYEEAIKYHRKALKIAQGAKAKDLELGCCVGLGNVYRNLGDFLKSLEYHRKSLSIAEEINDRLGQARCYLNIGNIYHSLGNYRNTIKYYERAREMYRKIENKAGRLKCLINIASTYCDTEDYARAIGHYRKSLKIAKEIGARDLELWCYIGLETVHLYQDDFEKAYKYSKDSLEIADRVKSEPIRSVYYRNLGIIHYGLGKTEKAEKYLEKSLKIARKTGDLDLQRVIFCDFGELYCKSDPALAYDCYERSIELSEIISKNIVEDEHKIGFFGRTSHVFRFMVPLCFRLESEDKAFYYIERSKSKAFLDILATTEIKPSAELTKKLRYLLKNEEIYLARLRGIQTNYLRETDVLANSGKQMKIRTELDRIYDQIEEYDAEYAFMRRGKPVLLGELKNLLSSQKKNAALIEYFVTEENIFIFVILSDENQPHMITIPLPAESLAQCLEDYWNNVVRYSGFQDVDNTWLDLSNYLIKPVAGYLSRSELVYFVPHNVLHYLPFHALELRGRPLIQRHPVVYVPSASLLRFCKMKGSCALQSCVSFGIVFEEEAKEIAKLFSTQAFCGRSATKNEVMKKSMNKDIIHFSCHGHFNEKDPLSSGIKLYGNQILTAREIFGMKLNTELVTLSACETGLNEITPGDELIGLTRAFIYAGTPSIVVSLWPVDPHSTHELMLEFYKQLKIGIDKATALQQAQIEIMKKKEYSHPYYWAPFILVGDWQ